MIFFKNIFEKVKGWFYPTSLVVIRVDNAPDSCKRNHFYIVGLNDPWLLIFVCPCGCKETIQLNLLREDSPSWSYSVKRGKINLRPSVRRIKGCKSHFWVRNGQIVWCYD